MRQVSSATPRTRAAVVDIGSNSIHLLVAERNSSRDGYPLRRVISPATLLGLGRIVAGTGQIDARSAAELTRVVGRQVKQAQRAGALETHVAATAAVRLAANGRQRMQALGDEIGQPIRILTEDREAELGFLGLLFELDPDADQLVFDGGGASTEVTLTHGRRRVASTSLPIGGSSLSVDYDDPPTPVQVERLRARVEAMLSALPAGHPVAAVATGGSVRKLPVIVGGHSGDPIDAAVIGRALSALQSVPSAVLARGTGLQRRRVQSLAAGAIIIGSLLRHYGLERCRNSPHGLREGIILAAREEPDHWWVDVAAVQARRREVEAALAGAPA
jgi:exopolyphosphatase/guanosine-5'-triphosphate,3'-diphosphate pyrophosphatase